MAGQKKQETEAQAVNSMENSETKLQKKHKNKQKRKLEEVDAELVAETGNDATGEKTKDEQGEALNGSVEISKKKKKHQKNEEALNDGSVEISKKKKKKDKSEEIASDGAFEESGKKKKKKEKDGEEKDTVNTKEEVRESSGGVVVSGLNVNDSKYKELNLFTESGLPDNVLECCKTFDKPSPIQSHSWPFLLDGRDLIGIAQTGSGE